MKRPRRRFRLNRGVIAAGALTVSLLTGPLWAQPSTQAAACTPVLAGRAGVLPCERHPTASDRVIEKIIGTTTTGAVLGGVFGGPAGMLAGAIGGAVGNIGW